MERFTTRFSGFEQNIPGATYVNGGVGFIEVINRLAAYEDIGYEPIELEEIITLFKEWIVANQEGRLFIIPKNIKPVNPCVGCDIGWGSISSDGKSSSCQDNCPRCRDYIKKLSEYKENDQS